MHSRSNSSHQWTTSRRPLVALVCLVILALHVTDAVPVYVRTGRGSNGNGGSAGSASNRGTRPPRPTGANGSPPIYDIERPNRCLNDTIFADCFLCGKIADDIRIYRACCQRDAEIISFCHRLLD